MSFRDILAIALSPDADAVAIAAAKVLAQAEGGRVAAILFEIQPPALHVVEPYLVKEAFWAELAAEAHEQFDHERRRLEASLTGGGVGVAVKGVAVDTALIAARACAEAREADITVMIQPAAVSDDLGSLRQAVFERVLFGSGRPVLLIPRNWGRETIGRNITIGWNGTRESARALTDAASLLDHAGRIVVITVVDETNHSASSTCGIAAHLERRGLKVETRSVAKKGQSESAILLEECEALNTDLVVLGGYGHSRMQETVFGGVTRELIRNSTLPLLLSH